MEPIQVAKGSVLTNTQIVAWIGKRVTPKPTHACKRSRQEELDGYASIAQFCISSCRISTMVIQPENSLAHSQEVEKTHA